MSKQCCRCCCATQRVLLHHMVSSMCVHTAIRTSPGLLLCCSATQQSHVHMLCKRDLLCERGSIDHRLQPLPDCLVCLPSAVLPLAPAASWLSIREASRVGCWAPAQSRPWCPLPQGAKSLMSPQQMSPGGCPASGPAPGGTRPGAIIGSSQATTGEGCFCPPLALKNIGQHALLTAHLRPAVHALPRCASHRRWAMVGHCSHHIGTFTTLWTACCALRSRHHVRFPVNLHAELCGLAPAPEQPGLADLHHELTTT